MFSLGVEFKTGRCWGFLFKSEERARNSRNQLLMAMQPPQAIPLSGDQIPLHQTPVHITSMTNSPPFNNKIIPIADDFGTEADIKVADVSGIMFEDMTKTSEAAIERGLHQARGQATLNKRAQADPTIRTAAVLSGDAMRMNGPQRFS